MSKVWDYEKTSGSFEGEKVKLKEILNENLIILDFSEGLPSQFRTGQTYTVIHARRCSQGSKEIVFFTASQVLLKQLQEMKTKGKLPLRAKIVGVKNYLTLQAPE